MTSRLLFVITKNVVVKQPLPLCVLGIGPHNKEMNNLKMRRMSRSWINIIIFYIYQMFDKWNDI